MTRTRGASIRAVEEPATALARLADIRMRGSVAQSLAHNWQGWLGSTVLHSAVVAIFAALAWGVVVPAKSDSDCPGCPVFTDALAPSPTLVREDIDHLVNTGVVDTKIDDIPNLPYEGDRPNDAFPLLVGNEGVPDWFGIGCSWPGKPGGGPPGDGAPGGIPEITGKLKPLGYDKLDLVIVFDATGSMGGAIGEVKSRIRLFVRSLNWLVPDTRLGLVAYRDLKKYDLEDYQYTVRLIDLQTPKGDGMAKLERFLRETEAYGGGDIPEAVMDGVKSAMDKMSWRKDAKRVIVVFGDAPPRPEDNGVSQLMDLIRVWRGRTQGVLSTIDTTGNSKLMDEFRQMAEVGGGQSCFLNDERAIVRQFMIMTFPKELKGDLEPALDSFFGKDREENEVRKE